MDIVLFSPSTKKGWDRQSRVEMPLNLLFVATPLVRQGYRVHIVDQSADPDWRKALFEALNRKPLCFGITSMTGFQIFHALNVCREIKNRYPDLPIVWGGIHASLLPRQTLENEYVDIVVVGEGEVTFLELVKTLETSGDLSQVAGIAYKKNGEYHFTGSRPFVNLDEMPPLAYQLLDVNRYRWNLFGIDHIGFQSSRGCIFRCAFCWDPIMHKRRFRAMTPATVIGEIQRLVSDYGVRGIWFTDDNFFVDLNRAYEILYQLSNADLGIHIGKLHIRADSLIRMDRDFLELLVRAGVQGLTVGVESGDRRILELIRKDVSPGQVIEANRKLIPYPIFPNYTFMMGLPTETVDEFCETVRLARKLTDENPKAKWSFNIYTPYPGTALYDVVVSNGLKPHQRLEDWQQLNFRKLPAQSPWIPPKTKKFIKKLGFSLEYDPRGRQTASYMKVNPLVAFLARAYSPVAQYRVNHLNVGFPIEAKMHNVLLRLMRKH